QTDKNTQGPGHKDHQKADDQARDDDGHQFTGVDQQPQGQEHEQLAHPGHSVKEVQGRSLVDETGIADHQSPDIDGEKPIALDEIGKGKDKDTEGEDQDGVEGPVVDVQIIDGPYGSLTQEVPRHTPNDQLHQQVQGRHQIIRLRIGAHDGDQGYGQDIGHGVVAPALQLQHWP